MIHSVLLKHAASDGCFSKRNLWSDSPNSKSLASNRPLESHLTSEYKRRCLCSTSISSRIYSNGWELRAFTLMWLITLITFCKMLLNTGDIFLSRQHFSINDTMHRLIFRSNFFNPCRETRELSSHCNGFFHAYTDAKWPIKCSWYIIA